ncbi:MAG: ATP-grasp domain-containing protein [Clostridia bacterium]|nr:ATP-grasp domain-containing protein [Clostridia bacterium]
MNCPEKRVLILGAGRGQTELYRSAKRFGFTAIAASVAGDYPGFALADEIVYADISDKLAVSEAVEALHIDAVATACIDTGIEALGYVCDKFSLRGPSAPVGALSADKLLMKEAFRRHCLPSPEFRKITCEDDLKTVRNELRYPLVVKAVDLQGSRGISIVSSDGRLSEAYSAAMAETRAAYCIVEEYVEGIDCGAQALVVNGDVLFVLPTGNISFRGKTNIPVGHYVPFDADPAVLNRIDAVCRSAVSELGIDNCAVNFDLIVSGDRVYIIELTSRLGANCLPELINAYYGVNVYDCVIAAAAGVPVPSTRFERVCRETYLARMILPSETGVIRSIENRNHPCPGVIDSSFFVRPGDQVHRFENSRHCAGQVIVKGNSLAECMTLADSTIDNIDLIMMP